MHYFGETKLCIEYYNIGVWIQIFRVPRLNKARVHMPVGRLHMFG